MQSPCYPKPTYLAAEKLQVQVLPTWAAEKLQVLAKAEVKDLGVMPA